jgi:transcriptional regulator with PAS, ATPase and Fis domain
MVDLRPYEKLHTIQLLKGVIRRWWGVELALADAKGYTLDHADGRIVPPQNEFCRLALFSKEGFRRCNESVRLARDELKTISLAPAAAGSRPAVVHPCHLGFDVVAAPIILEGGLEGFLYTGGSVREDLTDKQRRERIDAVRAFGPAGDVDLARTRIPLLAGQALEHLMDLLEFGAKEIAAYHAELKARERETGALTRELGEKYRFENIVGSSRTMQQVFRLLEKIVESDSTVLVQGESGTGKELVARAIHYNGPRAKKAFVVQNCSAFNDNLLESALFGHAKGAFTGAIKDKKGLFEIADGGTFFLDEVGDMSPALQVKLLRVLQEGTFTPVGSTETRTVDVRVIAATHKDLHKMVQRGEFREDLYYRINVIRIVIPPLRERVEDLPLLIEHFLRKHHRAKTRLPRLATATFECFQRYPWPGNIRELENEIERLLVLGADLDELPLDLVSPRVREGADGATASGGGMGRPGTGSGARPSVPMTGSLKDAVEALEREMIMQGLIRTHWNKSQLAKELGISRSNLIQKCAYYGLDKREGET